MCGRFSIFRPQDLGSRFGVSGQMPLFEAAYNITPGSSVPVITAQSPNRASLMRWGLVPSWAQDPQVGFRTINARAEGIEDKPSFRKPIRSQRCLVPVDGFYEWQKVSREGKEEKIPHFIHLLDQRTFAFAGLYDLWRDEEGKELSTFTIVTTGPNELMVTIHNRMPVILPREDEPLWLDASTALDRVLAMLRPYPAEDMAAYPVSKLVNNPRSNGPELIAPIEAAEPDRRGQGLGIQ
jgi:putative SOS response-associated peptidase YedK